MEEIPKEGLTEVSKRECRVSIVDPVIVVVKCGGDLLNTPETIHKEFEINVLRQKLILSLKIFGIRRRESSPTAMFRIHVIAQKNKILWSALLKNSAPESHLLR
jgi:endonuclease V-like protein UPF0215 family